MSHQSKGRVTKVAILMGVVFEDEHMLSSKRSVLPNSHLLLTSTSIEVLRTRPTRRAIIPTITFLRSLERVRTPVLTIGPSIPFVTRNTHRIIKIELSSPGVNTPPTGICNRKKMNGEDNGHFVAINVPISVDNFKCLRSRVVTWCMSTCPDVISCGVPSVCSYSGYFCHDSSRPVICFPKERGG